MVEKRGRFLYPYLSIKIVKFAVKDDEPDTPDFDYSSVHHETDTC